MEGIVLSILGIIGAVILLFVLGVLVVLSDAAFWDYE